MTEPIRKMSRALPWTLAAGLLVAWGSREALHARERAEVLGSKTITLADVKMTPFVVDGKQVGELGIYLAGDTPGSSQFVTGRLVLNPGETPHPPHVHPEEEVMVIEQGEGDIVVDGKVTKVGPGSVMYTTPNVSHGIVNTGKVPIVFYFMKWVGKGTGK
ncbi:cupin domain-containing protein [Isosphaeraceae bacterium EP7]